MFGMSLGEVLFIGVLALLVIGPKQLPEVARHIGRFLNDLRNATSGFTDEIKKQAKIDFDLNKPLSPPPTPLPPKDDPFTDQELPVATPVIVPEEKGLNEK
jgi:sec-independent protein translocase protein TatB